MYKEYDIVVTKNDLQDLPKGTKGVIVMVYELANEYEVEFVDENNDTICFLTVPEHVLMLATK